MMTLDEIVKEMKMQNEWHYVGNSVLSQISQKAKEKFESEYLVDELFDIINECDAVETGKFIKILSLCQNDEFTAQDVINTLREIRNGGMSNETKIRWYKIAAKAVNTIQQFTKQFNVPIRPIPDEDGVQTSKIRTGESYMAVNERKLFIDVKLVMTNTLHVNIPMKSRDKKSVETILIDVSASMRNNDPDGFVKLYMLNRLQHVRDGKLIAKFVLFGTTARYIEIESDGKKYTTFSSDTPKNVLDTLESYIMTMTPTDGTTIMSYAIELVSGDKSNKVITIVTDDDSRFAGAMPVGVTINSIVAKHNHLLSGWSKRTQGIHATFASIVEQMKG